MTTARALPLRVTIPQPAPRPFVGNVRDVGKDAPVQGMMRLAKKLGPIYRLTFPSQSVLVVSSHELVNELSDDTRFDKVVHASLESLRDLAGDALFTAYTEEPNWGRAHRILTPAFGPAAMRGYFAAMLDVAEQMVTKWERLGEAEDLDIPDNMTRLTLDTIALCGFGVRFNSFYQREMHPFVAAMVRALAESSARTRRLSLQTRLMLLTRRQYEHDLEEMSAIVDEVITARRRAPDVSTPRDLLGLMLEGRDPVTGQALDDRNIRHQIVTFLIAGHETTSGLLSLALYFLLQHPEVLARAQAEVDAVIGDATPTFEHLAKLTYLDQVLRETLRLWPTAPAYGVRPLADTTLAGTYDLEKDQTVLVLLPTLHRDPAVWADAETFDPERFAPGARERIPPNAWKPFGNGQRACIGRAFATQEALLVLALLLQRFDPICAKHYELEVKETLTLKPEGLRARMRRRSNAPRRMPGSGARAENAASAAVMTPSEFSGSVAFAQAGHVPLLVLYGSNAGSSEAFARRIAADASSRGYSVAVSSLDAQTGRLPKEGAVVIVCASYNGQAPDNAKRFVTWLEARAPGDLAGVSYTVLGCGHRDWAATYQAIPRQIDERMHAAGATRLNARGECDAAADFFGDFERWYTPASEALDDALGVEASATPARDLYEVTREAGEAAAAAEGLRCATVVEVRELVDMTSPFGRSKRHVEVELEEGVTYAPGDYLVVLPENDEALIERVARRFGFTTRDAVRLQASRQGIGALPVNRSISIAELVGRHVELTAPATLKQIERLAAATPCPPERVRLEAFLDPARHHAEILDRRVTVLDLLEDFASCGLSFAAFLEMLPPMRPRQYSISSSPRANDRRCSLTVAVVDAAAWSGRGASVGPARATSLCYA